MFCFAWSFGCFVVWSFVDVTWPFGRLGMLLEERWQIIRFSLLRCKGTANCHIVNRFPFPLFVKNVVLFRFAKQSSAIAYYLLSLCKQNKLFRYKLLSDTKMKAMFV